MFRKALQVVRGLDAKIDRLLTEATASGQRGLRVRVWVVAHGISGFSEDEVEGAVVEVGEVSSKTLGGAKGAAYLFHGDVVAALRLDAGAGGDADEAL